MDEKIIGENKKFNIKILALVVIVIIVTICIIICVFGNKNDKKEEKITYLESVKEISKQAKYLNSMTYSILEQINAHKVSGNAKLSEVVISGAEYSGCDGNVTLENNVYSLTAKCKGENKKSYTTEQKLIKGSKLLQMKTISKIEDGYLFMGISDSNAGIVGILSDSNSITWETEIPFDSPDSMILSALPVIDGYVVVIQKPIDEKSSELKIVKLDKNGKITKTSKIETEAYVLTPKSNFNDTVLVACDDAMFVLNKDGDLIKKITKSGISSIAIDGSTVSCIDSNETIYSYDKNGKELHKLKVLNPEKMVMEFEVMNNNYFVLYKGVVLMFDDKGKEINKINYDSLGIKKDKREKEHEQGMFVSSYRVGNNFYTSFLVDGYLVTDKYNQNGELIERVTYEYDYLNMSSGFYNLNIFLGDENININYSEYDKFFIKTIYSD